MKTISRKIMPEQWRTIHR